MKNKKKTIDYKKIWFFILLLLIFLLFIFIYFYLNDYYKADLVSINNYYVEDVVKDVLDDGTIVYSSVEETNVGIIFYPGGKVDYVAYEPLIKECASYGYLCIIVDMPYNLAIFDVNKANDIISIYNNIESWYIGGHSLGGAMAASYLNDNHSKFSGLILLGAYSTNDLSNTNLNILSIYGSEDKVLNKEKYDKYKSNLPNTFKEYIIDGGNHAYFGMYGEQDGDGEATISNEEQIDITMNVIDKFIKE